MLKWITFTAVIALILTVIIGTRGPAAKSTTAVDINGIQANLWVADSRSEQQKGLSGVSTAQMEKADGMMFIFNDQETRTFTMDGMKFDLDVIWIQDGKVKKISENVSAPLPGEEPETMSSSPIRADAAIEFPAGYVDAHGILIGYKVQYD